MVEQIIDVVIIGAGPAGLQAAVHAARKKASVLVFGRVENSSIHKAHVENYLCVEGVTAGAELLRVALTQATLAGAEVWPEDVLHLGQEDDKFIIKGESGRLVTARGLIIATGTSRKKLKVPGEKELLGRGVSYCVDCDANFYRNAKVAVVGNESAAVDGALTLTKYASEVHLVCKELAVTKELAEKLKASSVVVHTEVWATAIVGEKAVSGILLDSGKTLMVDGVFIELGAKGAMELATSVGVLLDSETFSYIETNKKQETNIPGIYAAGDIAGPPWQMAKAVGEGCVAGWEAANHANRLKRASESA